MSARFNVAICGTGGFAVGHHIPSLRTHQDQFQLIGVYDVNTDRAKEVAGDTLKAYPTYTDLLADTDVDVVFIITKPLTTHTPAAKQALQAGKHVVIEKPMGHTAEACDELIDLAHRLGLTLTVHHNRRLNLDFLALRETLDRGDLGRLSLIESRIGSGGYTGGDFEDWGIHLVDQMLLVNPAPLKEVSAILANPAGGTLDGGYCEATLRFETGPITRITAMPRTTEFLSNGTPANYRFYAVGSGGAFTQRVIEHPNDLMNATQNYAKTRPVYAVPDYLTITTRDYYDYLYDSLAHGAPLLVKPEEARNAVRVLELITQSARQGQTVTATQMRPVPA